MAALNSALELSALRELNNVCLWSNNRIWQIIRKHYGDLKSFVCLAWRENLLHRLYWSLALCFSLVRRSSFNVHFLGRFLLLECRQLRPFVACWICIEGKVANVPSARTIEVWLDFQLISLGKTFILHLFWATTLLNSTWRHSWHNSLKSINQPWF